MKKTVLVLMAAISLTMTACNSEKVENDAEVITPDIGAEIISRADGNGQLPSYSAVSEDEMGKAIAAVYDGDIAERSNDVADGVTLKTLEFGDSKAYILKADMSKCSVMAETPYNMVPNGTAQSLVGQANIAAGKGFAVMGGFAAATTGRATNTPKGIIVKNGETVYNVSGNDGSVFFGLYEDGKPFACTYAEFEEIYSNKVREMVAGTRIIVDKNKALTDGDSLYLEKSNRTAAGFSADRETLYMVYAENVDGPQLANLLLGSGCSMGVSFGRAKDLGFLAGDTVYGVENTEGPTLLLVKENEE